MTDASNPTPAAPTPAGAGTTPPNQNPSLAPMPASAQVPPTAPVGPTATPQPAQQPQPTAPQPANPPQPEKPDVEVSTEDSDSGETPLWRKLLGFLVSWIIIPAALVYLVHNFVFQAWYVDGQSMEPTFQNGNYLIVSKLDVSWKKLTGQSDKLTIKRGDVVIFNPPNLPDNIFFIKRAIGLPGDRVVIKDGTVTIFNTANPAGIVINEPYVGGIALEGNVDKTVPAGSVFVLGDNRNPNASQDSRYFGPIPMERFIGTAALRLLPVYEFGQIAHPDYGPTLPSM